MPISKYSQCSLSSMHLVRKIFFVLGLVTAVACSHMEKQESPFSLEMSPPKQFKEEKSLELHGDKRIDPYFWMKKRDTPQVLSALNLERNYYDQMSKPYNALADKIFSELKSRVKEDDSSVPYKQGSYWYYTRFEIGKEYPIYCRKKIALTNPEEVILDVNLLSVDQKYTSVSNIDVSTNEQIVAYAADFVGRRFYDIYFKDLKTGKVLKHSISKTTGNMTWANDNETVFFSKQDPETLRSEKIFRFNIKSGKTDEIYSETDEIFSVGVGKSLNEKYLFIETSSFDSSEVRFLDANKPLETWQIFLPREAKHEYQIEDGDDGFYIKTNWQAENFRIMKAEIKANSNKSTWKEVIPANPEAIVSGLLVLNDYLVVTEESKALSPIRVFNRKTEESEYLSFPDPVYVADLRSNAEYNSETLRYSYQSLVSPPSTIDYTFKSKKSEVKKIQEVPTYNKDLYQSERQWAQASDGSLIPLSIVYKKELFKKGHNPLLVYGYGSYGLSMDASFRSSVVSLLDRGFVYAIAHIRGGSEMGRYWYEQGRMNFKKNTFSDFVASTEFLIKNGFGKSDQIFAQGGSAGGLLMGAIANLRPDLYRGIVSQVPFVDVLTTMLDPDIPLTTSEYEQWGNPNQSEAYNYIKSYSPYDQISSKPYPHMLIVTGYHDSQVQYWEPAKYVAKIRDYSTSKNPILFKIDMDSGHSGASGRFKSLKDRAAEFSFILPLAGITK